MSGAFVKKEDKQFEKRKRKFPRTAFFIILMLFYPIFHFLLMWFGVNINSILLTFQYVKPGGAHLEWVPIDQLFINYINIFKDFSDPQVSSMYTASLVYFVLNCLITLPISLLFAYFIFKKIYAAGVFKVIFYLPSILPIVALTLVYTMAFGNKGFLTPLFGWFGVDTSTFFLGKTAKWMVWIFCFWTGIGYNVMMLTAGMARIPRDILESSKMDGVPPLKEFIYIIIPLTWPTITTLFIFGMMGVFGTYLQPMLLVQGQHGTNTIGLQIFNEANNVAKNHPATIGLFCTMIGTPIVLGVRALLNHFFKEVNF